MDLDIVLKAVETAFAPDAADAADAAIRAASAMPANASDFDRGIAAGIVLARYLDRPAKTELRLKKRRNLVNHPPFG